MSATDFEKYVELMRKSMDWSIDPTADFIKFARGNFRTENYDRKQGTYLPVLNGSCYEDVLLNETITYPSLVKAQNYYKSHKKEFPVLLKNQQLTDFCGTFPAYDENWQMDEFDWIKASAMLSSMCFRITMSYRCEETEGHRKITLSVIGPDEFHVSDKHEMLRNMDIPEAKIPEIIADFHDLEWKFNSFTPKDGLPLFERVNKTYAELKREKFDYCKFIEVCIGDILKENDAFVINNLEPGYFDKFVNMFQEAGPRAMANYITYAVAAQMENEYYSLLMTEVYFRPALIAAGFSTFWNEQVGEKRKEALRYFNESFESIKHCFKKDYSEEKASHEIADEEVIKFIESNFDQEEIEKEYEDIVLDPEDFVKNYFYLRQRGYTESTKKLNKLDIYSGVFGQALRLLDFLIRHYNRPMSFYFSGWELRIWYNYISNCRFEDNSVEFLTLAERVKRQISNRKLAKTDLRFDFWIKHYVAMIGALQLAYQDYCKWMAGNENKVKEENLVLEKFNLNSRKSFFIAFVQHHYVAEDLILNRVILALINSSAFSDVFNCKIGSPMGEQDKCILLW